MKNAKLRDALEIIAGTRQCIDNLMSNVDVARRAVRRCGMTGAWDGVPENPSRPGWHAVESSEDNDFAVLRWTGSIWSVGPIQLPARMMAGAVYLGPVLSPAEVEARERAAWQRACEAMRQAERERDEYFNRLGRITSELGLPMEATASRIIEAIDARVSAMREACASVDVRVTVPPGADQWTPLEAWEEALLASNEAWRAAVRGLKGSVP